MVSKSRVGKDIALRSAGLALLCLAAFHLKQQRWAYIGAVLMLPGLVVPITVLLIVDLTQ